MTITAPSTASDVTSAQNGAANNITGSKPTNTADGDLLYAFVFFRNAAGTIGAPSGWTQRGVNDTTNATETVYTKPIPSAAAETATTYNFTTTGGSARTAIIIGRLTGVDLTTPIDVAGTQSVFTGTTSIAIPAITTVATATMLMAFGNAQNSTATASVFTPPAGMSTVTQIAAAPSSSSSIWVGSKSLSSAGTTGTISPTLSPSATNSSGWLISFKSVGTAPTAAFTSSSIGTDGIFDASTSSAVGPATISSYAWTFGDTGTGSGVNPTHKYASGGTYTVGLTVTDSNSLTGSASHSITITAPGTQADPTSVTLSTGLTSNSGTVLNAITDKSAGAPVLTTFASGGDLSVLEGQLGPISPPTSGDPLIATVFIDRLSASTGTLTGKLYEGATLRSTATAPILDMTATGGSGNTSTGSISTTAIAVISFPWSDVSAVTDWNQLLYKFSVSVS